MDFETIRLNMDGAVAKVTLNRPEVLNAMTTQLGIDIRDAFRAVRQDEDIKVVVLTGEGKAFCAGADIKEALRVNQNPLEAHQAVKVFLDAIKEIMTLDVPVVARINGDAFGGGSILALACDFKVAVDTANFGFLFVRAGLTGADAGATYVLPRMVGPTRAAEILMLGEIVAAPDAFDQGMITRVVAAENLDGEVDRLVKRILSGPSLAIKMTKRALAGSLDKTLADEFDFECYAQTLCIQSEDAREGFTALLEKRKPVFNGR